MLNLYKFGLYRILVWSRGKLVENIILVKRLLEFYSCKDKDSWFVVVVVLRVWYMVVGYFLWGKGYYWDYFSYINFEF